MTSAIVNYVAIGLSLVGFILVIVGIATPEWSVSSVSVFTLTYDYKFGLWQACVNNDCIDYKSDAKTDKIQACEAFAILAVLSGVTCFAALLVYAIMGNLMKSKPGFLLYVAIGAGIFAAISVIITTAIWGDTYSKFSSIGHFGYSFALTIVGGGLLIIAVIVSVFIKQ